MSKARLVITAVVMEGRSQGEVARAYGVSQGWISRLVARYRAEADGMANGDGGVNLIRMSAGL
jgi:transposase